MTTRNETTHTCVQAGGTADLRTDRVRLWTTREVAFSACFYFTAGAVVASLVWAILT